MQRRGSAHILPLTDFDFGKCVTLERVEYIIALTLPCLGVTHDKPDEDAPVTERTPRWTSSEFVMSADS